MTVHVLEVPFQFNGKKDALFPVILKNNTETILVDCGYPAFLPLIEAAALKQGIDLSELTGVIITHHDIDHMGGLYELKEKYPIVQVYASIIEEKYVNGSERSLRLKQAESLYNTLPEDQKPGAVGFMNMLKAMKHVPVDHTFSEDEEPFFLDGLKVINTPGHMSGHISLYLKDTNTLIAADALVIENGELEIANPQFTLDLPEAIESVKKLQQFEIEKIICYHGGVMEKNIKRKLEQLVSKYPEGELVTAM